MPFGDRTGPAGLGPRTGRGAGFCGGYDVPGSMNPGWGWGSWGRGRGGGRGWRNWFYATGLTGWQRGAGWPGWPAFRAVPPPYATPYATVPTREQELDALRDQAGYFETALADIRKRIENLEAKEKKE